MKVGQRRHVQKERNYSRAKVVINRPKRGGATTTFGWLAKISLFTIKQFLFCCCEASLWPTMVMVQMALIAAAAAARSSLLHQRLQVHITRIVIGSH